MARHPWATVIAQRFGNSRNGQAMTGLIIACCTVSLLAMVPLISAAHRAHQGRHRLTAQEALVSMTAALEADVPQHELLREMARMLVEQDQAALALEARVRALLPGAAAPGPDAAAPECLAAAEDFARRLRQGSAALPAIEASVMRLLDQPEPREAASAFVAEHADLSRNALARAQFVHIRDHTEQVSDTAILQAALRQYDADISVHATRLFADEADEYAARATGPHIADSARQAARNIFRSGVSALPVQRHAPDRGQPPGGAACDTAVPGPTTGALHTGAELRPDDVFAFPLASPWRASAMAYTPFFGFVAADLRDLCLLDETWARLQAAVQGLLLDVNGVEQPGGLWRNHWPSGPPSEVIGALIGQRITSIVRARRLAWSMSDCHRTLMTILADADLAGRRLADAIANGMAQIRSDYLAEIGRVPRLDTTGGAGMAGVAAQLHETGKMHLQLVRLLLADAARSAGSVPVDAHLLDVSRLLEAVRVADQAMIQSQAALAAGSYLEAIRGMLDAPFPLRPDGFPGLTFYRDLLAQARPMAVLAVVHRLALARWAALALNAFFRSRHVAAEMISQHVDDYRRAYGDVSLAVNTSLTMISKGEVLWRTRRIRTGPTRQPSPSATACGRGSRTSTTGAAMGGSTYPT